jgi:hypothetical protein
MRTNVRNRIGAIHGVLGDERGMALAVAVFAMVIIAALVAGTFYAAYAHSRMSRGSADAEQAFQAAEAGVDDAMSNWVPAAYNVATLRKDTVIGTTSLASGQAYTTTITKLNGSLYLIRSQGTKTSGGKVVASQLLATLARSSVPSINIASAITVQGGIKVSGSSQINGNDLVPGGWGSYCAPAGGGVPGIRDSSNNIQFQGSCSGGSCVTTPAGVPKTQVDPTITSKTFTQFGDLSFDELAAQADKVVSGTINGIAPSTTGSPARCNTAASNNWGDPLSNTGKCFSYFPIIYAPGDLHITGGYGQGILLVDGNFDVNGGFEFYGPVIVKGSASSTGTGGHIYGGLLAGNADLGLTLISGNSVVDYSACAVSRALLGSARVVPLKEHSWSQLY